MASLDAARVELADLNQATEHDFLQVGEKLYRFLEVSSRIAEQCSAMVGVLSGAQVERGTDDLCAILDGARDMAEQAAANRGAIEQMIQGVGRITQPLTDLNAKMRSFRVMATLIRIEGSRLDQAGVDFETLADDVRKLACDIEENGKAVLASSIELREIVKQAGAGIAEFGARQRRELPVIQKEAETGLAALREKRGSALIATREMAARYDSVRREIGGLVTSLQFHDITRQQIEHVASALEQAIPAGDAAVMVRICRLQSAQLEHARAEFLNAVTQVKRSLVDIAADVLEMAGQAVSVLAGGADRTFLAQMEDALAGIRSALTACAESRYSLSTVADAVAQGVQEMAGSVSVIEEIGIRMQRIALNANIKAIRMGDRGSALGAVADAIQRLAADSTGQTEIVAQGMREVADCSGRLSAMLMESGGEDQTAELERVIGVFHTADEENRRRLSEIGESGRSFAQELQNLSSSIQADRLLADVCERAGGRLDEVVAEATPLVTADAASARDDLVENLESQYTMHAERTVHRLAAGEPVAVAMEDAVPALAGVTDVPEELGENVELF
jgi:hypothetical protein